MGIRSSTQFDSTEKLAKLWPFAGEIRGKVGDVVFRRFNGKTIVCRAPKPRSTPPTEAQVAHTKKFGEAAREAKRLLQDPLQRTYYETIAAGKDAAPFAILVGELLRGEAPRDVAGFTVFYRPTVPRPLSVDEILAHVQRLTPAETRCLKSKLDELVGEAKGGEQGGKGTEQGGKG